MNENVVTETKKLLLKYVPISQIYISGYDFLAVTGQVTLDNNLDINFKYEELTHTADIRITYTAIRYDIDAEIINGECDYSKFCQILADTITSYQNYERKKFIKMVLGL